MYTSFSEYLFFTPLFRYVKLVVSLILVLF